MSYSNKKGGGYEVAEYHLRPRHEFRQYDENGYSYASAYDTEEHKGDGSGAPPGYRIPAYQTSDYSCRQYDPARDFRDYKSVYEV